MRRLKDSTPEDALAVARSLRIEGDLRATLPQPPRRSRARRYHPRRRRAAGSLLAYIPGLILSGAEVPTRSSHLPTMRRGFAESGLTARCCRATWAK